MEYTRDSAPASFYSGSNAVGLVPVVLISKYFWPREKSVVDEQEHGTFVSLRKLIRHLLKFELQLLRSFLTSPSL